MNLSVANAYSYGCSLVAPAGEMIYPFVSLTSPQNETTISLLEGKSFFLLFGSENEWNPDSLLKKVCQNIATLSNGLMNWIRAASRPAVGHFSLALLYAQIKGAGIHGRTIQHATQIAKRAFLIASLTQWLSLGSSTTILALGTALSEAISLGHMDSLFFSKALEISRDKIIYSAIQYLENWIPYSPLSTLYAHLSYFLNIEDQSYLLTHAERTPNFQRFDIPNPVDNPNNPPLGFIPNLPLDRRALLGAFFLTKPRCFTPYLACTKP